VSSVEQSSFISQDADALGGLEARIQQAVELVARLRQERDAALEQASEAKLESARLVAEVKALDNERRLVRSRIEKLLGQIDQLGG
jgi:FtsZ-binding cell division protein ZapB